jgi:hypothetical protein
MKLVTAAVAAALLITACTGYSVRDSGNLTDLTLAPGLPNPAFTAECTAPCSAVPGRGCC